jgi:prevent-host-death family protein
MVTKITATELARNLSDILNRVRYKGERFVIERNGESVATLEPPPKRMTIEQFVEFLRTLPRADDRFADDLEEIRRSQGALRPPRAWE